MTQPKRKQAAPGEIREEWSSDQFGRRWDAYLFGKSGELYSISRRATLAGWPNLDEARGELRGFASADPGPPTP